MRLSRDRIERDGYVVIPSVLNQNEVRRLRDALREHFDQSRSEFAGLGKHQPNAASEVSGISWIFSHPTIIAAFRELYGQSDLIFTGNCDAHMNMLSWWHKDSPACFSDGYFSRPECRLYRAGIYLQDHVVRDGLTVRRGSHYLSGLTGGDQKTLSTRAGDVVFFDMRLTHAGQFANRLETIMLKAGRRFGCTPSLAALRNSARRIAGKTDKLSIFFTYGLPGPDTEEFCRYEFQTRKSRFSEDSAYLPEGIVEDLRSSNVDIWPAMLRSAGPSLTSKRRGGSRMLEALRTDRQSRY